MGDMQKNLEKTEAHYQQLVHLYFPTLYNSLGYAVCLSNLASFYTEHNNSKAEEYFVQADALFSAHFSLTLQYADFLENYGLFKYVNEMPEQGKECILKY